tara:strand:- start:186 stop:1490 length:1305 start_codon:yes stop_codon:yes gene_type:complete
MKNMETFTVRTRLKAQPRIEKMLKRIARAFQRRGLMFAHSFGEIYIQKRKIGGLWFDIRYQDLTITMASLSDDWQVLYTTVPADPNEGDGSNAVHMLNPTIDEAESTSLLYPKFRDTCDHCTSGKRGRHKTITIRHKQTGGIKTVGTSCLFEYTAIDPALVENIMAIKGAAESGWGGGARTEKPTDNIADFAIKAALYIHSNHAYRTGLGRILLRYDHIGQEQRQFTNQDEPPIGFCSMKGHPQRYMCDYKLEGTTVGTCDWSTSDDGDTATIDPAVAELAQELIDYATNLSGSNSFEFNCRQVWTSGVVSEKTAGIAGGVVASFLKNRAKVAREAQQAKQVAELESNNHIGTVGEKHEFGEVSVDFVRLIDGYYGQTTLTKFLTPQGDLIVWFRSGNKTDIKQGDTINLSGKIKKHDDYKGRKQTVITRGKIE